MAKKPLDILKEGLAKLKDRVKARKKNLLARLQKKEKISDADEQWLDHDANLVDEEAIIDALEKASDYERGLTRLTPHQKGLVQTLKDLGNGILQRGNRMAIEELLNPVSERENIDNISAEEIFRSVQEMREAMEMMEVNGGDDGEDGVIEEKPTRKEALTAAATLGKYISDINEPFARKLEAILASFGRQTRLEATCSLEPSFITDYFIRS
ncbi:hypothetical protein BDN71DRAFT_1438594 [Pleurotus eryngii]|uniref:Uncharacterized protein n=1 Tax=Pleurotus eryngii TaxID=5323 RepID=A0A9P6AA55_PLEER|nr:hypothetical protein BDN71DRAFT_1438594 [Pleurotus eryngii]